MATLNDVLDTFGILEDKDAWDVFKQLLVNFKVDNIEKLKKMEASMVARIFEKCGIGPEKLSQFEKTINMVTEDESWEGFGGKQDDAKEYKVKKDRGGTLPNTQHSKNRPPNADELSMYTLPSLSGKRGPYEGLLHSLPRCVLDVASRIRPDTTHISWEMGQWIIAQAISHQVTRTGLFSMTYGPTGQTATLAKHLEAAFRHARWGAAAGKKVAPNMYDKCCTHERIARIDPFWGGCRRAHYFASCLTLQLIFIRHPRLLVHAATIES